MLKVACLVICITLASGSPVSIEEKIGEEIVCNLCTHLINDYHHALTSRQQQDKVTDRLLSVCNRLDHEEKIQCEAVVYGAGQETMDLMASQMNPEILCGLMGACPVEPEYEQTPIITETSEQRNNVEGGACKLCEFVVQTIDQFIKQNSSEAAINATVYNFCNKLPGSFKKTCLNFAPKLVTVLAQGLDPKDACTKIHLCTGSIEPVLQSTLCEMCHVMVETGILNDVPNDFCFKLKTCQSSNASQLKTEKQAKKGDACDLCEFVVQLVDKFITQNSSEAAINATVYKLCNKLPEPFKDTCLTFAPNLVKALASGLDPKKACTKIHLCDSETLVEEKYINEPEREIQLDEDVGDACGLCKFVVQLVDKFITKNSSEAAINATVYKLCNKLPEPFKDTCLMFAPNLVTALASGLDPKKACTKIHLCDTQTEVMKPEKSSVQTAVNKESLHEKVGAAACDFCKFLVTQVDAYLQNNKSSAAINATLDKVCNLLPPTFKAFCKSYEPELIKALENGLDPEKACSDIHLCVDDIYDEKSGWRYASCDVCKSEMEIVFPEDYKKWCPPTCENIEEPKPVQKVVSEVEHTFTKEIKEKETGAACELCKFIVQEVDIYLKNNHSDAAINSTLYKVCDSLPAPLKTLCLGYIPGLEKALKNGFDPQKACAAIHVCKNSSLIRLLRSTSKLSFDEVKCDLCRDIVSSLDNDVFKDEDKVKKDIDNICDRFPPQVKDKCHQAVDPDWKNFWNNLINNIASPDNLCDLLTLCKKKH